MEGGSGTKEGRGRRTKKGRGRRAKKGMRGEGDEGSGERDERKGRGTASIQRLDYGAKI